jgi:hypothetical protein
MVLRGSLNEEANAGAAVAMPLPGPLDLSLVRNPAYVPREPPAPCEPQNP